MCMLLMMISIGLWQSTTAEAAANITWTTTSVKLDATGAAWINDEHCPKFVSEYGRWRVTPTVYME